jgi:hypothetical protein
MRLGAVVVGHAEIKGQEVTSLPPTALLSLAEGESVKPETVTAGIDSLAEGKSVKHQTEVE